MNYTTEQKAAFSRSCENLLAARSVHQQAVYIRDEHIDTLLRAQKFNTKMAARKNQP